MNAIKEYAALIIVLLTSVIFVGCSKNQNGDNNAADSAEQFWESRKQPRDMYLAVRKNGEVYYLSKLDMLSLSDNDRSNLEILGVMIDATEVYIQLIVSLEDYEDGALLTQDVALSRYGDYLPDHGEANVIMSHYDSLSDAIVLFGGEPLTKNRGEDVWWTSDGHLVGYAEILWDYSNVKAKARKVIRVRNLYRN